MKVTVRARASSRAQMHTQLCSVLAGQRRLVRIWSFFSFYVVVVFVFVSSFFVSHLPYSRNFDDAAENLPLAVGGREGRRLILFVVHFLMCIDHRMQQAHDAHTFSREFKK